MKLVETRKSSRPGRRPDASPPVPGPADGHPMERRLAHSAAARSPAGAAEAYEVDVHEPGSGGQVGAPHPTRVAGAAAAAEAAGAARRAPIPAAPRSRRTGRGFCAGSRSAPPIGSPCSTRAQLGEKSSHQHRPGEPGAARLGLHGGRCPLIPSRHRGCRDQQST